MMAGLTEVEPATDQCLWMLVVPLRPSFHRSERRRQPQVMDQPSTYESPNRSCLSGVLEA